MQRAEDPADLSPKARSPVGRAESVAEALARHERAAEQNEEQDIFEEDREHPGAQVSPQRQRQPDDFTLDIPPPVDERAGEEGAEEVVTRPKSASRASAADVPWRTGTAAARPRGASHAQRSTRNLRQMGQSGRLNASKDGGGKAKDKEKERQLKRRSTGASGATEGTRPLRLGFALGERLMNRGRKDAGPPDRKENDDAYSEEEDDDESEAIYAGVESPASRWSVEKILWSFVFLAGIAFFVAGLVVAFVPVDVDQRASRILFVVGGCLLLWPLSALVVRLLLRIAQAAYSRSHRFMPADSSSSGSGKAYYYMLEASDPLRLLIWAVLTEVLILSYLPRKGDFRRPYYHAVRVFASLIFIFIASTITALICVRLSQNFNMQAYLARMAETLRHESIIYGLCAVRPHSLFSVLYDEVITEHESDEGGQLDPAVWGRAMRYINSHRPDGTELLDGKVHTQARGGVKAENARLVAETSRLAKFIFDKLFVLCDTARRLDRGKAQQGIRRTLSSGALVEKPPEVTEPEAANQRTASSNDSGSSSMLSRNSADMGPTSGSDDPRRRGGGNLWGLFRPSSNHQTPRDLAGLQHEDSSRRLTKETTKVRDRRRIYKAQFVQVVGKFHPELEEHANEIWDKHFDPTGMGYSNVKQVGRFLQVMFKARKNMSLTLQDSQTVFQGVRRFIFALAMIVVFMIILTMYDINVSEVWVALTGALLAWSFVFGETMRGVFECMVFLLDLHPYDVGDQIEFGGVRYEVRRINLRSTELLLPEGSLVCIENRHIYASNSIINYSRSENRCYWMSIEVDIPDVTEELLQQLRADFGAFLRKNADRFDPHDFRVHARSIAPMFKCELKYVWVHAYPFISLGRAYNDQDLIITFICRTLTEHSVHFSGSGLGRIPFNLPETAAAASAKVALSHDANAALPTADPSPPNPATGVASTATTSSPLRPQTVESEVPRASSRDSGLRRRERSSSAGDSDSSRDSHESVTPESPENRSYR